MRIVLGQMVGKCGETFSQQWRYRGKWSSVSDEGGIRMYPFEPFGT